MVAQAFNPNQVWRQRQVVLCEYFTVAFLSLIHVCAASGTRETCLALVPIKLHFRLNGFQLSKVL